MRSAVGERRASTSRARASQRREQNARSIFCGDGAAASASTRSAGSGETVPLRGDAVPDEKLPSSERSLREFEWEAAMLIILRPTTASMKPAGFIDDFCSMKFSLKLIGVERSRAGLVMEDLSDVVGIRDTGDGAATMRGDALGILKVDEGGQ